MKRMLKKSISVLAALTSAVSLCSLNHTNAYYAGQKHTWRIYEKVSTLNLEWYTSTIRNTNNYTFGSSEKKELIVNSSNFYSNYSSNLKALTNSYSGSPKINGEGYLSMSTWYTPTSVSNFSVNFSYETSNGARITPVTVLVGDFNQDGYVNTLDAEDLAECLASNTLQYCSEIELLAGDANNDGVTDVRDASVIARFCNGSINNF